MRKRYLRFALIVCAFAYLGAVGTAAIRIATRSAYLDRVSVAEFNALVEKASAAASLGFLEEPFKDSIRHSLETSESLAAVIVTGPTGPEYAAEREGGYLTTTDGSVPRFASGIFVAPSPLVAPLRVENARNATLSASRFRAIPGEIAVILRDSLLLTLVPLVVSIFALLVASSYDKKDDADRNRRKTASGSNAKTVLGDEFDVPDISSDVGKEEAQKGKSSCLFGPDGVLGWEEHFAGKLEAELRRAASFEQDLVLLTAEVDVAGDEQKFKAFAEEFVGFFSFRDLTFKRGAYGASIILPNLELEGGIRLAEDFVASWRGRAANLEIGLTARAGRLVEASRMIAEADGALARARKNGKLQIMAFKPDPDLYRSFVASGS